MSLPLTVIGGYLGAGKTTLLNRMLRAEHGRRIAVIVNDFGALNVDASLITEHSGDTIALSNGCICCSAADGTAVAIGQILKRAEEFEHIAIEASGVAEPGKVARNAAAFQIPLDGVIVLADAEQLPEQVINRYTGRAVVTGLRQADLIALNKCDLVTPEQLAETRTLIEARAPGARVVETQYADLPLSVLFGARRSAATSVPPERMGVEDHHAGLYQSEVLDLPSLMSREELDVLIAKLSSTAIRAKGHVCSVEEPETRLLYQQVGRRWTLEPDGQWPDARPASRIVRIRLAGDAERPQERAAADS